MTFDGRGWTVATFATAMLWLGLLLGVSFLATPAKFLAPSLALPVALDVGRHTFTIFNKVEWCLAILLLLILLTGPSSWLSRIAAIGAAMLLLVETLWLLPLLDQRVSLIMSGQPLSVSNTHSVYIALDVIKLMMLALVAGITARRIITASRTSSRRRLGPAD